MSATWVREQNKEGMEEGRKAAVAQANTLWLGWFFSVAVSHAARCKSVTTFQHVEKTKIKGNLLWFNELPLPSCSPPFADIIQADHPSKQGCMHAPYVLLAPWKVLGHMASMEHGQFSWGKPGPYSSGSGKNKNKTTKKKSSPPSALG